MKGTRRQKLQPFNAGRRRRSRATRRSLALVFALVFAPPAARRAAAECVPFATPPAIGNAADGASSVRAADLDGDGDLDVLSASRDDATIAWHENLDLTTPGTGDGSTWTLHAVSTAAGALSVFAADVDGDGDLDALAASLTDDTIAWYANDGSGGGWTLHAISTAADGAISVFAADVDGDGDLDALSASVVDDKIGRAHV